MAVKERIILIREGSGIDRNNEPVSVGLPLQKGEIRDSQELALFDWNGSSLPLQITPLNMWPDGSLKWILAEFQASVSAGSERRYRVKPGRPVKTAGEIKLTKEHDAWLVDTGRMVFSMDTDSFYPFKRIAFKDGGACRGTQGMRLVTQDNKICIPEIKRISPECSGPMRSTLLIEGMFFPEKRKRADFMCRLNFYANKSLVKIEFTFRNPMAAHHAGGLWDLGDKGSLFFRELSLSFPLQEIPKQEMGYSMRYDKPQVSSKGQHLLVYQESSGGENWRSPVHVNHRGEVPFNIKGYEVMEDGQIIEKGQRAAPVIWCGRDNKGISLSIDHFWQNFPKSIEIKDGHISAGLFPACFSDMHEIQGGEQKTDVIYVDFLSAPEELRWTGEPLLPMLEPDEYERSGAVPGFKLPSAECKGDYQELLDAAVNGDSSFFAKREIIDEYGWRNFGEVYADHEAVRDLQRDFFISHYNNQYDLIFGACRQFMISGNPSWYRLMTELAAHVRDIDIYHTDDDRDEFNNGLFWHTDHYIDAATSTHRSYSRDHLKVRDPRFCGGGPSTEHCYTTGLMYHYYLTGDCGSREAAIKLADWCIRALRRQTTLTGMLYSFRKKWPLWKNVFMGGREISYRYPLNRGTGNSIVACLDAFELTGNREYLERAEEFIKGCVHPNDDIESRDLLNAEAHWSYTVFFAAIGRYLDIKTDIKEEDLMLAYARESLLAYASWMVKNEYPYLDHAELLEFPTETWPAQDMRKSCVFYYASRHCGGEQKNAFIERARFFFDISVAQLKSFPTRMLARPLTLLLQNCWVCAYLRGNAEETVSESEIKYDFGNSRMFLTKTDLLKTILSDISYAFMRTSPGREMHWIRTRLRPAIK